MEGIFEPIHRSYRMSLTMAILLGILAFGNFYFWQKYQAVLAQLSQCQGETAHQAGEISQCLNARNELETLSADLAAEKERLKGDLDTAQATIANLEQQQESNQQHIASLEVDLQQLQAQQAADALTIQQLSNDLDAAHQRQAELQPLEAQHDADVLTIQRLHNELEAARQQQTDTQSQLDNQKQELALTAGKLEILSALELGVEWLQEHRLWVGVFLAIILGAASVATALLWRRKAKPAPHQDPRSRSSQGQVWVCMTRQAAQEYARRIRQRR